MKFVLIFVGMLATLGCATTPPAPHFPLAEADPVSVRECRPVGTYPGPFGYRFWGPPPVLSDFRYQTALKAREAGATHIYWRTDVRGYYGETRVTGYAFDCRGVAMPRYGEEINGN